MKKTKILFLALFAVLAIIACRKDDPNNNNTGGGGTGGGGTGGGGQQGEAITSLDGFWQSQKQAKIQNLTAQGGQYTVLTGAQGTKITIQANSFLLNGVTVSGPVDIELIEAYDKGSILAMGLNTMGRDQFGNYGAMVSGGEFFFRASSNGQQVDINPSSPVEFSTAPFPDADFNNAMLPLFLEQDTSVTGDSVWVPIDTSTGGGTIYNCRDSVMINLGQSTYCFQIGDNSRWINCDYFRNWGTALTNVTINLPATHNFNNTKVYLSFDGLNAITGLRDNGGGEFFVGGSYQPPVGQAVHLVVISEQNGVLVHNIQPLTLTSNHTTTLSSTDITPITTAALQTALSSLP